MLTAKMAEDSRIMALMHQITDIHGPRLTGSPQLRRAQDWALSTFKSWGLINAHLEPWRFGHQGWSNELVEASVVAPFQAPINARALPWTPSTPGLVVANAVLLAPPGFPPVAARNATTSVDPAGWTVAQPQAGAPLPTRAELQRYLDSVKPKVRGAAVLVGVAADPARDFTPQPLRTPDAEWAALFDSRPRPSRSRPPTPPAPKADADQLTLEEADLMINRFLVANGAAARIHDSGERRGLLRPQSVNAYDEVRQVPAVMIANGDYGRMARVLADGTPVRLRLNVRNHYRPEGRTEYNVLAELPGTDRADEVVMLGGHLDSWAAGTGATDNGAGAGIMMEAIRLLRVSGLRPRRTIRIALWSGEEQGVFGSQAYVRQHFGSFEQPKPAFSKLSAYVNIDTGTGVPRGASVFGPPAAAAFVTEAMKGFRDWGFMGARMSASRMVGGSDSGAFYAAGLPAMGLFQDPFDYSPYTHHTSFDTYEELYEPDLRKAAIEVAALIFALANDHAGIARFDRSDMPPPAPDDELPTRLLPSATRPTKGG